MTPEAQRIAIAKACGWTNYPAFEGQSPASAWDDKAIHSAMADSFPWISPSGKYSPRLPDYLNDLNAIRESERKIIDRAKWYEEIQRVLWPHRNPKKPFGLLTGDIFDIANATAAQRSEAFLKTLNLWTYDP